MTEKPVFNARSFVFVDGEQADAIRLQRVECIFDFRRLPSTSGNGNAANMPKRPMVSDQLSRVLVAFLCCLTRSFLFPTRVRVP